MRKFSILLIPFVFSCELSPTSSIEKCTILTDSLVTEIMGTKRMVLIPSGSFLMGDSLGDRTENFVHEVEVSGFYMDETPVTYEDFQKYVDDGGTESRYWKYSSYNVPDQPVTGLNWYHAVNYCNWRSVKEGLSPSYLLSDRVDKWGLKEWKIDSSASGYRLPTEAEWEYAARGGLEQMDYPWGDDFKDEWANYDTDRGFMISDWWRLAPVKSQRMNGYGLYGMAGNVWEWTQDWYNPVSYETQDSCNPVGPSEGSAKVVRGGGWGSPSPEQLKVYRRSYAAPSNYNYSIGFRCVRPALVDENESTSVTFAFNYQYPGEPLSSESIDSVDFFGEEFTVKLADYLADNFPQCLYFLNKVDEQPRTTPLELARLIVEESESARINPLFVTSIMISESGFATVSFPRWWNNPMAYHWQNKLMDQGDPSYDAGRNQNRKYRDLRAAIKNYSRIRRSIYYERAEQDLYAFHMLYVGYEAEEWMYTIGKVFREVANLHITPHEPATGVGEYIYTDWVND